jgi:hypothetical protein
LKPDLLRFRHRKTPHKAQMRAAGARSSGTAGYCEIARLKPELHSLATGTFNLLSKTESATALGGAFSVDTSSRLAAARASSKPFHVIATRARCQPGLPPGSAAKQESRLFPRPRAHFGLAVGRREETWLLLKEHWKVLRLTLNPSGFVPPRFKPRSRGNSVGCSYLMTRLH